MEMFMTDDVSASAAAGPDPASPPAGGRDDNIAAIRQQRDTALGLGDRETAQEFDALERELYDAGARVAAPARADAEGSGGEADIDEADHAPLTGDEAAGVFAFLDEVDPDAAAALRADWGNDVAANLGYAHLWFTTQYTQDERDSMVVTPGLVRMAARMGRRLASDRRTAGRHRSGGGREVAGGATGQGGQVGELRRRREDALRTGNYRQAQELDEQERAAWARRYGDGPIVGHAGRTL